MADTDMPTTYEAATVNLAYLRSIPGILRIVEIVLSLVTLICGAVAVPYAPAGWVTFVSVWSMITILVWFILYLLGLNDRIPGPALLIELIYFGFLTVLYLIAGIVAAATSTLHGIFYVIVIPSMAAAAAFSFVSMIVLAVDVFFLFQAYRGGASTTTTGTAASTAGEKETY